MKFEENFFSSSRRKGDLRDQREGFFGRSETDTFLLETFCCLTLKGLALRLACNDFMHKNCKRFFFVLKWEVAPLL